MSADLLVRWKSGERWFAARPRREKLILLFAALAVAWAVVDAIWLTPSLRTFRTHSAAVAGKESELSQLTTQKTALEEAIRARDIQLRRDTEAVRQQLAGVTGRLAEFEKALVPARRMSDFLRGLVPGAGVEIVALRTLAPTPLILRSPGKGAGVAEPASKEPVAANLYKHGIEITLAGNYESLLDYLTRLERAPQKVLWGRLDLRVEKHPRNELVLVLYTLSLDSSWLVLYTLSLDSSWLVL